MNHSHGHFHDPGHHMHHQPASTAATTLPPMVSEPMPHDGHHGHLGDPVMMSHMKMYFHSSFGDLIFFQNWILSNTIETLMACLIFFIIAVLYEGLKCYREYHLKQLRCNRYPISMITSRSGNGIVATNINRENSDLITMNQQQENGHQQQQHLGSTLFSLERQRKMFTSGHLYQSFLHIIQVATSYTLMLAFMTFNIWICLSILFGAGVGYFIFCWRKASVIDINEHCQ